MDQKVIIILHRGGLQRGPGPAGGHQEEGHDQKHNHHHAMAFMMLELLDVRPVIPGFGFQQFAE